MGRDALEVLQDEAALNALDKGDAVEQAVEHAVFNVGLGHRELEPPKNHFDERYDRGHLARVDDGGLERHLVVARGPDERCNHLVEPPLDHALEYLVVKRNRPNVVLFISCFVNSFSF